MPALMVVAAAMAACRPDALAWPMPADIVVPVAVPPTGTNERPRVVANSCQMLRSTSAISTADSARAQAAATNTKPSNPSRSVLDDWPPTVNRSTVVVPAVRAAAV